MINDYLKGNINTDSFIEHVATKESNNKVNWSRENGSIGVIPLQQHTSRRFGIHTSVRDFLKVVPDRPDDSGIEFFKDAFQDGDPVAPPVLFLRWRKDQGGFWEVKGHEGRGRAMAYGELFSDLIDPIPIDIIARISEGYPPETDRKNRRKLKADVVSDEMVKSLIEEGVVREKFSPLNQDPDLFLTGLGVQEINGL